jgi:hypothetical protein
MQRLRAKQSALHRTTATALRAGSEEPNNRPFLLFQYVCVCVCVYIYIYVCVCVCVCIFEVRAKFGVGRASLVIVGEVSKINLARTQAHAETSFFHYQKELEVCVKCGQEHRGPMNRSPYIDWGVRKP